MPRICGAFLMFAQASEVILRDLPADFIRRSPLRRRRRRGRDSNPRYPFEVYTLSRRALSTTQTPLRIKDCKGKNILRFGEQKKRPVRLSGTGRSIKSTLTYQFALL